MPESSQGQTATTPAPIAQPSPDRALAAGKAGLWLAVVLVGTAIGWLAGRTGHEWDVLVFLAGAVVALVSPLLAVCILAVSFTLGVVSLGAGGQTLARVTGFGVGLALLPQVVASWIRRNQGRPVVSGRGALLVGFLAFALLSGIFADDRAMWLRGIWMLFVRASLFACIVYVVRTTREQRAVFGSVAGALTAAALIGAAQWVWGVSPGERVFHTESDIGAIRVSGVFQSPIDLSFALVPALGCAAYFVVHGRGLARLGGVLAMPALLFCLAATMTRSAALGALALVALLFVLRPALPRWSKILVIVVLLGAMLAAPAPVKKRFADPSFLMRERSIHNRIPMAVTALRMAAANPLGVGLRNFEIHYDEYKPVRDPESGRAAHNMYLELAATIGIPGALCFLGWIAATLVWVNRSRRALLDRHARPEAAFAGFLLAILASMAFQGLFHTNPYQDKFFWLFMALGSGCGDRSAPGSHAS